MDTSVDFDDFFRREQPRLVAIAIGLTGVPEVARDLAQDALVQAYRDWDRVRTLERPGAWARRVTINASMSWHRGQRREGVARARLGRDVPVELPQSEGDRFWSAVRALPDRQRAVVALHYLDDMAVADVAAVLDVAPGTVKSTLFAARAALAAALGVAADTKEAN